MALSTLSTNQEKLLRSFLFFALAWPIFGTFMNTFLWRGAHNPILLATFNIGIFLGVPIGFWINAKLLQTIETKYLLCAGCILQGVAPLFLTIFSPTSLSIVTILGCILGTTLGLYWGNRNLSTLYATEKNHRTAFLNKESIQNILTGVCVPLAIGFGIASMQQHIQLAYISLVGIGFSFLGIAGLYTLRITEIQPIGQIQRKHVFHPTSSWNALRLFEILNGAITANESILSLLIILLFFGLEDAVGTTKGIMAMLTAIIMHAYRNKLQTNHFPKIMRGITTLLVGITTIFALQQSTTHILLVFGCIALITGFRTVIQMSTVYNTIDDHVRVQKNDRFLLLFDREIFLSVGRVSILLLFTAMYSIFPQATIQFGLLGTSLLHIPLIALTTYLNKTQR